jgi:hypothetical protein
MPICAVAGVVYSICERRFMDMSKINIDPVYLDIEIFNLTNLFAECEANSHTLFFLAGKGKTSISMENMNTSFLNLNKALAVLIQGTIELLQNAKDGYIDADETTAKLLEKLQEGVASK